MLFKKTLLSSLILLSLSAHADTSIDTVLHHRQIQSRLIPILIIKNLLLMSHHQQRLLVYQKRVIQRQILLL